MTIICAMHRDGETWIGADSRTTTGSNVYDYTRKWIVAPDGGSAMAICGSGRARYLLERMGDDLFHKADAHAAAARLRRAIIDDNWTLRTDDGGPGWISGGGIWADMTGVWQIHCDFTVNPVPTGVFLADGSGEPEARGVAFALMGLDLPSQQVVQTACEAACAFDNGCGGPIFVRRLGHG